MKAINFPEVNLELAKDQPQYEMLPVYVESKLINRSGYDKIPKNIEIPWEMTACFQLSPEEIEEINKTGKLWYTQTLMGRNFQPIRISTSKPKMK